MMKTCMNKNNQQFYSNKFLTLINFLINKGISILVELKNIVVFGINANLETNPKECRVYHVVNNGIMWAASQFPSDLQPYVILGLTISIGVVKMIRRGAAPVSIDPLLRCRSLEDISELSQRAIRGVDNFERYKQVFRHAFSFSNGNMTGDEFRAAVFTCMRKLEGGQRTTEYDIIMAAITALFDTESLALATRTIGRYRQDADRVVLTELQQALCDVLAEREDVSLTKTYIELCMKAFSLAVVRATNAV